MTGPSYSQIIEIMNSTMAEVMAAGHDVRKCVWELSPSIRLTIEDELRREYTELDAIGGGIAQFNGIPIRSGVTDESTGILLKMVHPEPWQ